MPNPRYHGDVRPCNAPEFVAIPYAVFRDACLSHAAKLVYGRLKLYSGKNGLCYPKHATLAREVDLSERQLRTVLAELRSAGWIDWKRARTSCIYAVHPERKEPSDQTGEKLPITPEGIRRSRPAESRRHKRSIENHHPKKEIEKNTSAAEASVSTAMRKLREKQNSEMTDDDPSNCVLASPKEELRDVFFRKTGQQISADVERRIWETVELHGLTPEEFLEQLRPHVPNTWRNPAGFLTNFARKIASVSTAPPEVRAPPVPEPPRDAAGRCSVCRGAGYIRYDENPAAREYCACSMGRELRRVDARPGIRDSPG